MKKLIQNITIYCTQNVSIKVYGLQNCYVYALEVKCFPNYGRFRYGHCPHRNESYDLKEEWQFRFIKNPLKFEKDHWIDISLWSLDKIPMNRNIIKQQHKKFF